MRRIIAPADIHNIADPTKGCKIDLLVDTGASHIVLPHAWKDRFGDFEVEDEIEAELANQAITKGLICGPARIQIEGFRIVHGDVIFMAMEPEAGWYEPLLGYIPLEQSSAAVDMIGHRLVPVRYLDMKRERIK